jgi:DNA-directed RNA polymerase subunit RPC12/RpoP
MPATYQCAACNAKWVEDHEPLDCPKCGSRIIERMGRSSASFEDNYNPPESSISVRSPVSSTTFSVLYWLGSIGAAVGYGILVAVSAQNQQNPNEFTPAMGGALALLLVSASCVLAAYIISVVKIYRAWDLIQPLKRIDRSEAELTSPGLAVGLLFVPFFNFYWNFKAIHGLATKANKYMMISGIKAQPMKEGLAQTYCILVICSIIPCLGALTGLANAVIYYLVILDVDRMRGGIQEWREGGQKPDYIDDIQAL